ncbi:MAG TPA: trypsin-like peptidase domain-containing protein [Candidatus Woesebacteria bacterium]|nr:trypsin-like peptidase domain-containing protein [Candidatus Woesebacteria bacterium]
MKKGIVIGLFLGVFVMSLFFLFLNKKETIKIKKEIIDEESVVTEVVEKATPSVVTIRTERDIGTGFIVSSDGLIVTNKHVVADIGTKYKVIIDKEEIEVKDIYRDPLNDLAIIKIEKNNLNKVDLGDSDKLKVGQSVIAIGTALGEFRSTVTTGVISGLGRGITAGEVGEVEKLTNVIQTDAAINPGNSGGPLFNSSGQVIGVNVAVSQSGQNIGFALPINLVKESIDYFRETGEFERPYLGVGYKMMEKGAWVESILENSPASKADIKIGDIIIEIDGQKINKSDNGDLVKIINQKKIGQIINIKIQREKTEKIVDVNLEKKIN